MKFIREYSIYIYIYKSKSLKLIDNCANNYSKYFKICDKSSISRIIIHLKLCLPSCKIVHEFYDIALKFLLLQKISLARNVDSI